MNVNSDISTSDPMRFIQKRFLEKRKINPQYSIAAYARDLGLSASFLSRLLSGNRPLTVNLAVQIATLFGLSSETIDEWVSFIISNSSKNSKIPKRLKDKLAHKSVLKNKNPINYYEIERFKAISQWHHLAILNLTFLKSFKPNSIWIARRLGISSIEVEEATNRLFELGLLEKKDNTFKATKNLLFVNQKTSDLSIRQFHQQMCEKAKESLQDPSETVFNDQYFSGINMAFDRKRMPEFKEKLQAITQEMMRFSVGGSYTDLYHLNIQLFPITKNQKGIQK